MQHPAGESVEGPLRVDFDRRLKLEFHGTRHLLTGLVRESVLGRLAGYEHVNDADHLAHDSAMRVVDRGGLDRDAASTS